MKICPICSSTIEKENQEYCLTCAWEFEYFFDELSEKEKKKYSHRSELYSSIYNSSKETKYIKDLEAKIFELKKQLSDFNFSEKEELFISEENISLKNKYDSELIVIDNIMYQRLSYANYNKMNWDTAKESNNMNYEEYKFKFSYTYEDWRLPTVEELLKLRNSKNFFYKKRIFLWSSEEANTTNAWVIKFEDGEKYSVLKTNKNFVVYVRDIKEGES